MGLGRNSKVMAVVQKGRRKRESSSWGDSNQKIHFWDGIRSLCLDRGAGKHMLVMVSA